MPVIVTHLRKGKKEFDRPVSVSEILEAFEENMETAFVVINGKLATSDKKAKPGDEVLVIPAVSGG